MLRRKIPFIPLIRQIVFAGKLEKQVNTINRKLRKLKHNMNNR